MVMLINPFMHETLVETEITNLSSYVVTNQMPSGGGTAALFDGNTSQTFAQGANNSPYTSSSRSVSFNWGALGSIAITRCIMYGSTDYGFLQSDNNRLETYVLGGGGTYCTAAFNYFNDSASVVRDMAATNALKFSGHSCHIQTENLPPYGDVMGCTEIRIWAMLPG